MADPAAHQIEQYAALRQHAAIEVGQRPDCVLVDMIDEPRLLIKMDVVLVVDPVEGAVRQCESVSHAATLSPAFCSCERRPGTDSRREKHNQRLGTAEPLAVSAANLQPATHCNILQGIDRDAFQP